MKLKENKGITLIALVVTIVVLLIIAGISIYNGRTTIEKAKLEELRTNMLLIQAKAKEYAEQANFKMGPNPTEEKKRTVREEVYVNSDAKLRKAEGESFPSDIPANECYILTEETFKNWDLEKIKIKAGEKYLIRFDDTNATAEVYNTKGYDGKHSLTEIDKIQ